MVANRWIGVRSVRNKIKLRIENVQIYELNVQIYKLNVQML